MVQCTLMSQVKTTIRTASKDILARAMAMEDITVEHRADVPTAYFDTKNRTLCLPVWEDMDDSLYDMLVGHEVSHALHTPTEGWQEFVGEGKGSAMRHMFINCVEDARIERQIKDKFPGLRRDFASAYKSLHERDLFELAGRDISELPLIDRLNLEFKLGLFGLVDVPFSAEEKPYVKRMAEATTFEEVMTLAEELYDRQVEEDAEKQEQESGEGQPAPSSGDDEEGEGSGAGSGEDTEDSDDAGEGAGGLGDDEENEDGQNSDDSGNESESGEDSGDSMNDDTDDGESADSQDGESGQNGDGLDYSDYENNTDAAGSTQRSFEKGVEDMRNDDGTDFAYRTLPDLNLENVIVGWKDIDTLWNGQHERNTNHTDSDGSLRTAQNHRMQELRNEQTRDCQSFLNKARPTVMHMVQQFQMKQAADADKRTSIAKTGVLDTVSMINYRWSEDIFVKNEVHADGKNHGIVIYIDWSGSMSGILQDTVEQCLVLTEFCQKAGIPFDVYAFSSNTYVPNPKGFSRYSDEYRKIVDSMEARPQYTADRDDALRPHTFQLYHYLSSQMNARQYKTAVQNFWNTSQGACYRGGYSIPDCLQLGCTPLNEAVLSGLQIIPEFQRQNGVQIVNAVFLTDGEGHSMGLRGYSRNNQVSVLRDQKTQRTYRVENTGGYGQETDTMLQLLKDRTGCNTIGIRLHDNKNIKNMRWTWWSDGSVDSDKAFEEACRNYKKDNYCVIPSNGYDGYFCVKGTVSVEFDALEDLPDEASFTRLKNAFIKGNTSKKSSRVIANRLIDIIAA